MLSQNLGSSPLSRNITLRRPPTPPLPSDVIYGCPLIESFYIICLVKCSTRVKLFKDIMIFTTKFKMISDFLMFSCMSLTGHVPRMEEGRSAFSIGIIGEPL